MSTSSISVSKTVAQKDKQNVITLSMHILVVTNNSLNALKTSSTKGNHVCIRLETYLPNYSVLVKW